MRFLTVTFCVLFFSNVLYAQLRLDYWGDTEAYLQDQSAQIFDEAYRVFEAFPPTATPGVERRLAFSALDAVLHDTRVDRGAAFMSFIGRVIGNIANALPVGRPSGDDMRIFRFYNSGFIVQTRGITVAIDLVRGGRADFHYISDPVMQSVVNQCDILFLTHRHDDHADRGVVKMFVDQGKMVVASEEYWPDMGKNFRVVRGATDIVRENIRIAHKNTLLDVRVYPGFQGDVKNNIYVITLPNGKTLMHTGDHFGPYVDLVARMKDMGLPIDVLMLPCAADMHTIMPGLAPAMTFTGHENEMGHSVDHREAYWLTFRRMHVATTPWVLMAWGESFLLHD